MRKDEVSNPNQALAYLTDCTLATVSDLSCKKSASKYETRRQIAMAQQAIDWMRAFEVDVSYTRADEVIEEHGGSVQAWADAQRREVIGSV